MNFDRAGHGEPLLLVHGSGGELGVWKPVFGRLVCERDVIAVDLPGHGLSPSLPNEVAPTPREYAQVLAQFLCELDLGPVDVVGNSVGGWVALELAKLGAARSVVAFSPAGLWGGREPFVPLAKLWLGRRVARAALPLASRLLASATGRRVLLGGALGRPAAIPVGDAVALLGALATAPDFDRHLAAIRRERFVGGRSIDAPVTIAFGARDAVLGAHNVRRHDELPDHAVWTDLPGCGHIPIWDSPELIVRTVLGGTGRGRAI